MQNDPLSTEPRRTEHVVHHDKREGGAGRVIAIIAVIAVVALAVAWMLGLFNVDTSGKLEAPTVSVEGGQVPSVEVETADINVGTTTTEVEVPTVDIQRPGDDGVAQ